MAKHSGSKGKSRRMTNIPLTAVGSGARVMDLFPLPMWLFVVCRTIWWTTKHWWVVLCTVLLWFSPWQYFAIAFTALPLVIYTWVYWYNRKRHPLSVARAAAHLARTRLMWARACEAAELNNGPRRPRLTSLLRPPRIANERGSAIEFTLNLARVGLTVKDLEDNKDYIAAALDARRSRVHRLTPGIARLTLEWEKRLRRSAVANPLNQINTTQLPRVELDQDVQLELDTSLLVVGESGSGKSNLTWHMINELNKYAIPYRLYVIDPKKVELAELVDSPYTVSYSDTPSTIDGVIEKFYDAMMNTFEKKMKPYGIRRIEISRENPLNILIIDELLLCKAARQGVDGHLGEILSAGRAAGYICIADSQLGQVDALSRLRDLFPQRVCMAVKSGDLTNAVLGPNAEARGARCTEITERGVGYVYTDFTGSFQRFKPPFIEDVKPVAAGGVWYPPAKQSVIKTLVGKKK